MPDPLMETISSTEVPALFGCSPRFTRWMIARKFMGTPIPPIDHNEYMDFGTEFEPAIIKIAARQLELDIEHNEKREYRRRNLVGFTADGLVRAHDRGPGIIEVKCVFNWDVWRDSWGMGTKVPKHVEIQVQVALFVSQFTWATIVVYYGGKLHYFDREPAVDFFPVMEEEARRLFDDVRAREPGDPYGVAIEMPLINQLFAPKPGKVVDLTADARGNALAYSALQYEIHGADHRYHEKVAKEHRDLLLAAIKDAEKMILPHGVTVQAKKISRKAEEKPRAASSYVQLKTYVPDQSAIHEPKPEESIVLTGG